MTKHITPDLTNRARGALLGLAAGDALGTTIEFTPPLDPFQPRVTTIVGGGPFNLPRGGWTDDTSMALCLADSLVAENGFDAHDQMARYVRWRRNGENSVKGYCFDIGGTTSAALSRFESSRQPFAGSTSDNAAGNGSLMRMVPVVLAATSEEQAILWAGLQSRTTHGARAAIDSCRFYARLIWRALNGATKAELLDPAMAEGLDLCPEVAAVAAGSYKTKMPFKGINGSGYVVAGMEAALWAFFHSETFKDGAILAVNLGQDTDTTGAIFGQLAGAFYGVFGIPQDWRLFVMWGEKIVALADALLRVDGDLTPNTQQALAGGPAPRRSDDDDFWGSAGSATPKAPKSPAGGSSPIGRNPAPGRRDEAADTQNDGGTYIPSFDWTENGGGDLCLDLDEVWVDAIAYGDSYGAMLYEVDSGAIVEECHSLADLEAVERWVHRSLVEWFGEETAAEMLSLVTVPGAGGSHQWDDNDYWTAAAEMDAEQAAGEETYRQTSFTGAGSTPGSNGTYGNYPTSYGTYGRSSGYRQSSFTGGAGTYKREGSWHYWLVEDSIRAGGYPGSKEGEDAKKRLAEILDLGCTTFIDLTEHGDLKPYAQLLREMAAERGLITSYARHPIVDLSTPTIGGMHGILDTITEAVARGQKVYLHCRGGVGRTVTVACCYLMREQGYTPQQAIDALKAARKGVYNDHMRTPQTESQERYIREWPAKSAPRWAGQGSFGGTSYGSSPTTRTTSSGGSTSYSSGYDRIDWSRDRDRDLGGSTWSRGRTVWGTRQDDELDTVGVAVKPTAKKQTKSKKARG